VKQSNSAWPEKRRLLDRGSLMLISKDVVRAERWDESTIATRTETLIDEVIRLWPGPVSPKWSAADDEIGDVATIATRDTGQDGASVALSDHLESAIANDSWHAARGQSMGY
jgi:hypothetical protein